MSRVDVFCKNCRWRARAADLWTDAIVDICEHPLTQHVDPVRGPLPDRCRKAREGEACGSYGKLFEPKCPWWRRILSI